MKTLEQIAKDLLIEIDQFGAPATNPSGMSGVPWDQSKYAAEIEEMRRLLITPEWHHVKAGGHDRETSERLFALVAKDTYYCLFYDPEFDEYALGFEADGAYNTFLYGDAVSTFLAR